MHRTNVVHAMVDEINSKKNELVLGETSQLGTRFLIGTGEARTLAG